MVKREFSNEKSCWKRWKKRNNLTTTRNNVVRMSWNVQLFCLTFVLECGFLGEKARKFFFYSWLVSFSSLFFSTGKKNIWVIDFIIWTNYGKQELQGLTSPLIILFCQSVLLTFSAPGITSRYSKPRVTTIYPILFNFVIRFVVYVNQILYQFTGLRINAIDDRYFRLDLRLINDMWRACMIVK